MLRKNIINLISLLLVSWSASSTYAQAALLCLSSGKHSVLMHTEYSDAQMLFMTEYELGRAVRAGELSVQEYRQHYLSVAEQRLKELGIQYTWISGSRLQIVGDQESPLLKEKIAHLLGAKHSGMKIEIDPTDREGFPIAAFYNREFNQMKVPLVFFSRDPQRVGDKVLIVHEVQHRVLKQEIDFEPLRSAASHVFNGGVHRSASETGLYSSFVSFEELYTYVVQNFVTFAHAQKLLSRGMAVEAHRFLRRQLVQSLNTHLEIIDGISDSLHTLTQNCSFWNFCQKRISNIGIMNSRVRQSLSWKEGLEAFFDFPNGHTVTKEQAYKRLQEISNLARDSRDLVLKMQRKALFLGHSVIVTPQQLQSLLDVQRELWRLVRAAKKDSRVPYLRDPSKDQGFRDFYYPQ